MNKKLSGYNVKWLFVWIIQIYLVNIIYRHNQNDWWYGVYRASCNLNKTNFEKDAVQLMNKSKLFFSIIKSVWDFFFIFQLFCESYVIVSWCMRIMLWNRCFQVFLFLADCFKFTFNVLTSSSTNRAIIGTLAIKTE